MPSSFLYPVVAPEATFFLAGLAQNVAGAMQNIPGLPPIASRRYFIRAISVVARENFGPQFAFFNSAAGDASLTDPAVDGFVSFWGFAAASGQQLSGTGLWRYYIDGLAIPYVDRDTINTQTPPSLHVVLQNLAATAKSANAAGAIQVTFWVEPMGVA